MPFLSSLETKDGKAVDESTLVGKLVLLYFSSSWCGACRTFTPLLSVLHEEAQEEEDEDDDEEDTSVPFFQVVYVSSDDTAEQCHSYMNEKHGDWLRIPFDSPLRNQLKAKYRVFAGKEQSLLFPSDGTTIDGTGTGTTTTTTNTLRKSGIPTLVVISREGEAKAMLDCDSAKVIQEVESKGTSFLDQWKQYKW